MDNYSKVLLFYCSPFLLDAGITGFITKTLHIRFTEFKGEYVKFWGILLILLVLYIIFLALYTTLKLKKIGIMGLLLVLLKAPFLYLWAIFIIFDIIHYKFIVIPYYHEFYTLLLLVCFYYQDELLRKVVNL